MNMLIGFCEVVLAATLGTLLYVYVEVPLKESVEQHVYNSHWQDAQDDKMFKCYQKMATQEEVNYCLLKLNVFI